MRLLRQAAAVLAVLLCLSAQAEEIPHKSAKELDGYRIANLTGAITELYTLDSLGKATNMSLSTPAEQFLAVAKGRADYALVDTPVLLGVNLEENGCEPAFYLNEMSGGYGSGFSYDLPNWHDAFNTYLAQIKADGRYDAIIDRWTTDAKNAEMPDFEFDGDAPAFKVGIFSTTFPFAFVKEGKVVGLEPELISGFAAQAGLRPEFIPLDFGALMPALESGRVDMISGSITITEERAKNVNFSDAYYFTEIVCIQKLSGAAAAHRKGLVREIKDGFNSNFIVEDRWKMIAEGLWTTILISLMSLIFGTLLGALVCRMRLSRIQPVNATAKVYIEIMRGIPILVLLMLMYYVFFAKSKMAAEWVAVVAFALNFAAFSSEIFRNGISAVDRGQKEAGLALGLSGFKVFFLITLPQALKKIIPVYKNEAVSLVKNTSVVGYIAILDLTKMSDLIRSRTFDAFFPLIAISIIYFFLAWVLGKCLDLLNRKFK